MKMKDGSLTNKDLRGPSITTVFYMNTKVNRQNPISSQSEQEVVN